MIGNMDLKKDLKPCFLKKTLEKETVCSAILNSPRNVNELIQTSINAVAYDNDERLVKNRGKAKILERQKRNTGMWVQD